MTEFTFKAPATETQRGTAYFSVEANTEEEARAKLEEDPSEYFDDFSEDDGGVEWEDRFERIG